MASEYDFTIFNVYSNDWEQENQLRELMNKKAGEGWELVNGSIATFQGQRPGAIGPGVVTRFGLFWSR